MGEAAVEAGADLVLAGTTEFEAGGKHMTDTFSVRFLPFPGKLDAFKEGILLSKLDKDTMSKQKRLKTRRLVPGMPKIKSGTPSAPVVTATTLGGREAFEIDVTNTMMLGGAPVTMVNRTVFAKFGSNRVRRRRLHRLARGAGQAAAGALPRVAQLRPVQVMRWLLVIALLGCKGSEPSPAPPAATPAATPPAAAKPVNEMDEKMRHCPLALDGAASVLSNIDGGVRFTIKAPEAEVAEARKRSHHIVEFAAKKTREGHGGLRREGRRPHAELPGRHRWRDDGRDRRGWGRAARHHGRAGSNRGAAFGDARARAEVSVRRRHDHDGPVGASAYSPFSHPPAQGLGAPEQSVGRCLCPIADGWSCWRRLDRACTSGIWNPWPTDRPGLPGSIQTRWATRT